MFVHGVYWYVLYSTVLAVGISLSDTITGTHKQQDNVVSLCTEISEPLQDSTHRSHRQHYTRTELLYLKTSNNTAKLPKDIWQSSISANICKQKKTRRGCRAGKSRHKRISVVLHHRHRQVHPLYFNWTPRRGVVESNLIVIQPDPQPRSVSLPASRPTNPPSIMLMNARSLVQHID